MKPTKPDWAARAVAKLDTFQKGELPVCLTEEVVRLLRAERRRVVRAIRKRGQEYMADSKKPSLTYNERLDLSGRAWAFKDLADELAALRRHR